LIDSVHQNEKAKAGKENGDGNSEGESGGIEKKRGA